MNKVKKVLALATLGGALLVPSVMNAQSTPVTAEGAVTAATEKVDKVGEIGAKAYIVAGGLALAGVVIGFIKKARR